MAKDNQKRYFEPQKNMPIQFRTELFLEKNARQISYEDQILCLGSCFATEIGAKLKALKFDVSINPMGIAYHPVAILNHLLLANNTLELNNYLVQHDGLWHSLLHHSSFSHPEKAMVISKIQAASALLIEKLQKASFITLTFGTSIFYKHLERNVIVTNNHKLSGDTFVKNRMSVDETYRNINSILETISQINPSTHSILTVSPVRHLRNGLVENQRSKSNLIIATAELSEQKEKVSYFPSYEIMMDDLRDYRFYKTDLAHPTTDAVKYIWEKFKATYIAKKDYGTIKKVEQIKNAFNHKPIQLESKSLVKFAKSQIKAIAEVQKINSTLDFSKELEHYHSLLG